LVITQCIKRSNLRVRLIHRPESQRIGGLGGAVQAGLLAAHGHWVVVMDGDLQHPPETVPSVLAAASDSVDLVVASRLVAGGSSEGLASLWRRVVSSGAGFAARSLFPRSVGRVRDPMSGFFAARRAAIDVQTLRPRGFKILLELLARNPGLRVREVPFTFAERVSEESKASLREMRRFIALLVTLRLSSATKTGRLLRFGSVGASGVAVNLAALSLLLATHLGTAGPREAFAAVVATQLAIVWNFVLSEWWVFERRPSSRVRRFATFWALNSAALFLQLPLADALRLPLANSYVLATGAALAILTLGRFAVCDLLIYRGAAGPVRAATDGRESVSLAEVA
jgi:dolichol-phosphate mannosyltransferase